LVKTSGTAKLWPRVDPPINSKGIFALSALSCYRGISQGVNLQSRFIFGQARSLRITAVGLLCIITFSSLPVQVNAQRVKPIANIQNASQPCPDNDVSERCQLKRAVSAALDDIANLKRQLAAAAVAIEEQEKAIKAANDAIAAGAKERAAFERTLAIGEKAIQQQQGLIATYERAIATLQTMVDMAMKRVDVLEKKVDKANARTATLGTILTVAGILVAVIKR
jgi:septal ring factor EnvC (AmiA/AmiB activator)